MTKIAKPISSHSRIMSIYQKADSSNISQSLKSKLRERVINRRKSELECDFRKTEGIAKEDDAEVKSDSNQTFS